MNQARTNESKKPAGPVIAAWVMEKSKWLEIFIYPNKFIGKKR